jgi:hypothetical protein
MSMEAFSQIMSGVKDLAGQAWDQLERPGKQGAAEMANALFNESAFVPYGEGQKSANIQAPQPEQAQPEQQQEMGGREM